MLLLSEEESISEGAGEDVRISWAHRVKGLRQYDLVHIVSALAAFHFSRASRCHVSTHSKAFICSMGPLRIVTIHSIHLLRILWMRRLQSAHA